MISAWHKSTVPILLLYVFFREFRPSEPYLTPYLNETKNFTKKEINNMIYPIWSYSQLPIFLVVIAFTDTVKYRPMIWFGALGYVATWVLLVAGKTVLEMQFMQVTYAIGTACEVAYKSYVFVAVTKENYSKASLYLAGSSLLGRSLSSFSCQILHDYAKVSFLQLNYLSLGSVSIALILALLIPPPEKLERYATLLPTSSSETLDGNISVLQRIKMQFDAIKENVYLSYKSEQTRRWAYWAVVTSTLYFMVGNSSQSLWKDLEKDKEKRFNGYVIGTTGLLSSLASWILTKYSKAVEHTKASVLSLLTMAMAASTFIPTVIQNLYVAYVCDALFNIIVSCCMTISLFKIAHSLTTNLYGFVVGVNATAAGMLDLLVTFIVMDEKALSFNPRQQYWVYTGFAVTCSLVYTLFKCSVCVRRRKDDAVFRNRAIEAAPGTSGQLGGFVEESAENDDDILQA